MINFLCEHETGRTLFWTPRGALTYHLSAAPNRRLYETRPQCAPLHIKCTEPQLIFTCVCKWSWSWGWLLLDIRVSPPHFDPFSSEDPVRLTNNLPSNHLNDDRAERGNAVCLMQLLQEVYPVHVQSGLREMRWIYIWSFARAVYIDQK